MRTLYFALWFLSFFFFFSSPNLGRRRLDAYHTSTHGVALVRIQNAGLKFAARGSLEMQDPKNRHLGTIAQLCWAISSQIRHVSTIGKKLVKQPITPVTGQLADTPNRGLPTRGLDISRMPSATLRAYFSFFWRRLPDRELSSYPTSCTCAHNIVNFCPLIGSLEHPENFNGFRVD